MTVTVIIHPRHIGDIPIMMASLIVPHFVSEYHTVQVRDDIEAIIGVTTSLEAR
jgi:hypothetical protein